MIFATEQLRSADARKLELLQVVPAINARPLDPLEDRHGYRRDSFSERYCSPRGRFGRCGMNNAFLVLFYLISRKETYYILYPSQFHRFVLEFVRG